jgi:predicted RNA-binding Zn-ribbon protein involved in translation (DUF1610 family)
MPIRMNCPSCGKSLSAPDGSTGKKAKCPTCGQIMIVPDVVHDAEEFGSLMPEPLPSAAHTPGPAAGPSVDWLYDVQDVATQPGTVGAGYGSGEVRRPCPECGEMIVAGAAKCRFCNAIFDPRLKAKVAKQRYTDSEADLTTGDWLLCILCSGIGCIVGIVYAIQGKPKGVKMVGISFLASIVGGILKVIIQASLQGPNFR